MNLQSLTNNLNKQVSSVNIIIMAVSYCGQPDVSIGPDYPTTTCDIPSPVVVHAGQDKVSVLLICTNGEVHHQTNAHVVSHRARSKFEVWKM